MDGIPRLPKSKFAQLADILRERIVSGDWGGSLPPERSLAEEFLVSRTTLRRAIAILEAERLVQASPSPRGNRAVPGNTPGRVRSELRRACILTPTLHGSPLLIEQLGTMRGLLHHAGIVVDVDESATMIEHRDPSAALRRIVARHPHSIWVLHKMPEAVQRWFEKSKLPAVAFGSVFAGITLPGVDVDFRAAAHHATGLCLSRGCQRIFLLVHRTPLAGDSRTLDAVSDELARRGAPPPHVMRHDSNRMRLMDALDREIVAKPGACDALIVVNHHHLLTALPHLLRRGVRIPEDLSVVHLSNDPSTERLSPLPFRYDPGPGLIRRLVAAIKTLSEGGVPKSSLIIPKLIEGESVRPQDSVGSKKNQGDRDSRRHRPS
ncbi:MAG: GntR family transcriptional regulator [Akkermansiaceae bacterium]|nr:GntR family transcriptional regulator [Akkermansiaceae bacterium]MCP5546471.1 GntR family transcriptional regulator [Akkermansiaceae bacterium]